MNNHDSYRFENFNIGIMMDDMRFSKKALKPGQVLPNVEVYLSNNTPQKLHELVSKKALLIVTGSLTCPMTLSSLPDLTELEVEFGTDISFVLLYVREAHPGENHPQPQTFMRKLTNAETLSNNHNVSWPVIIDDMDGTLHNLLDTKPNSVHLINNQGQILFQSLWAGDSGPLKIALSQVEKNKLVTKSISQNMMGPFIRSGGFMEEALKVAGRGAYRELVLGAPPIALFSKVSSFFGYLPKRFRGYAAMLIMISGIAAVVAILR